MSFHKERKLLWQQTIADWIQTFYSEERRERRETVRIKRAMQKLAKRIRVKNFCSIWTLVYRYLRLTKFCVILLCFNRLFTLDPQNEIQLLSTDSFVQFMAGLFIGLRRLTTESGETNISGTNKTHCSTWSRTTQGIPVFDVNTKFAAEFTFCCV